SGRRCQRFFFFFLGRDPDRAPGRGVPPGFGARPAPPDPLVFGVGFVSDPVSAVSASPPGAAAAVALSADAPDAPPALRARLGLAPGAGAFAARRASASSFLACSSFSIIPNT